MKEVYKNILKELRTISKEAHIVHEQSNLMKQKARLEYEKLQKIRGNQSIEAITKQINDLKVLNDPPTKYEDKFKQLFQQQSTQKPDLPWIQKEQFHNIHRFLSSQRTYQTLLERYNPGLSMDQQENVTKTANRVGLSVPE